MAVPAFIVDELGYLQGCNELFESISLVPHEILLGREWWQAFAARSAERARELHESIVRGGEPRGAPELDLYRSDGEAIRLSIHWLCVHEPTTRRPLWTFALHELVSSEANKSASAREGGLSSSELLALAAIELDELARDAVEEHRATLVARLSGISDSLRAASPGGQASLPLADVIKRGLSSMLADPKRGVRLKVETTRTVRAQPVDPARIFALVVGDARRRSPLEPVQVRVAECALGVSVEVIDAGSPVDAELQSRVCAPKVLDRKEGTAPPLEIAAALVHALGGRFEIESVLGRGVRVRFSLPSQ